MSDVYYNNDICYNIYGLSDCPSCLRAQALCMDSGVQYQWIMMDWSWQAKKHIKETKKWGTYPIITKYNFVEFSETLIGGFEELCIELEKLNNETGG